MTITTDINQAKDDLDLILGEVRRLMLMLPMSLDNADQVFNSLEIVKRKAEKVRASL